EEEAVRSAEHAKAGASGHGGTTDAATKRSDDITAAETKATQAVSDLEAAKGKADDAVSAAISAGASPAQIQKLQAIADKINTMYQKAQTDLDQITEDKKKVDQALTDAQTADTEKQKKETSEFEQKISGIIKQIGDTTKAASLQNVRDMFSASQLAAQQMAITGQGMIVQAKISLESEKMTVQQQLSELAMRAGATGYSNLLAQMAYAEAIREKAFNLEADIEKNRVDNAFTRAKAAAQLSKY
ncbi:hypothetical protein EBR66_08645, partial [bacterium]|nr:hypothetical protein [bacterium]